MNKRVVTLDGTTLNTLDVHDVAHEFAIVQVILWIHKKHLEKKELSRFFLIMDSHHAPDCINRFLN